MANDGDWRLDPSPTGNPVEVVTAFHRFLRDTLVWKCAGLTEEQLRWSPVPTGTSLLGLLKHSAYVERGWISRYIGGVDVDPGWSPDDPDADWRVEPGETFESIRDLFAAEAERSAEVLAGVSWEDVPVDPTGRDRGLSVGWVLTHMVEEVGRHCGHADLIRELIDGQTGE